MLVSYDTEAIQMKLTAMAMVACDADAYVIAWLEQLCYISFQVP